jgi:F420-dependent oxidoreductase-like protein
VAWAAEAYGSDAVTVLTWVAAQTQRIDVGSAVLQIPGRTPANTAMTAATLDALSGGRFRLGLGVSGPQVSEGWHGVRFAKPLARTREYISIVTKALARERLTYDGEFFTLPLPDGPGKALTLTVHPVREHIPTYLAAIGPKNLELAGELFDGWLAIFFSPEYAAEQLVSLSAGRAKAGKTLDGFDIVPTVPVSIGDDLDACAAPLRAYAALYVGGMGSRDKNFYNALACRMGYEEAAAEVQEKYLAKDVAGAMAAVPFEFIDRTSLIGPRERVAERLHAYAEAGVTTLTVATYAPTLAERVATLRTMAELLDETGLA